LHFIFLLGATALGDRQPVLRRAPADRYRRRCGGRTGPGGTAQLQTQGGVPIVNIVAPNGSGLSHNQFLDYNVDRQGLVLNNALQAGQSQLAGQLAANPQLQGQAASVILNEVISRNPSAINGAQEIFGRAADYVLANPNGIFGERRQFHQHAERQSAGRSS
jgi:filamentous hemagglutinin family protein